MENEPASTPLPLDLFQMVNRTPSKSVQLDGVHTHDNAFQTNMNHFDGNLARGDIHNIMTNLLFFGPQSDVMSIILGLLGKQGSSANNKASLDFAAVNPPSTELDSVEKPSLILSETNGIYERIDQARKNRLQEMTTKSEEIAAIYDDLLETCSTSIIDFGYKPKRLEHIEQDIIDQRLRFELTSTSLLKSASTVSLNQSQSTILLYTNVVSKMNTIFGSLKEVPKYFEEILNRFKEKDNPTLDKKARERAACPDTESKEILAIIDRLLDEFDELAKPLTRKLPTRHNEAGSRFSSHELGRLLRESLAATTLFQCFCSACPVQEHREHTAYLSLASNSSGGSGTRMAILSRVRKEKNLVWLRIDSGPPGEINGLKRRRSPDTTVSPSRKRKTDVSPAPKYHDSMVIDQTRPPIQVCPELLAQHEAEMLAMQMMDASNALHKIYLLPADKRPPEKCEPVSLAEMLLERHKPQMAVYDTQTQTLWKVQVARLIAEAVLRFDCPQTRFQWDKEGVIFYTSQISNRALEPFLKFEIESHAPGTTPITDHDQLGSGHGGWDRKLLNLAVILVQIGLFTTIKAASYFGSDNEYRRYIIEEIKGREADMPGDYFTVVRHCIEFPSWGEEHDDKSREEFREEYYRSIILPLKRMENSLLAVREERN